MAYWAEALIGKLAKSVRNAKEGKRNEETITNEKRKVFGSKTMASTVCPWYAILISEIVVDKTLTPIPQ